MDDKHPIRIRIKYYRHGFEEGVDDNATQMWYVGETSLTRLVSLSRTFFNISASMNQLVRQIDEFVIMDAGKWSISKIEAYVEDVIATVV